MTDPRPKRVRKVLFHLRFSLGLLAAFVFLSLFSIYLLRTALLNSAQSAGTALAHSYAMEEQNNLTVYETLLALSSRYMDQKVAGGASDQELRDWLTTYFENITGVLGKQAVDPYAVVGGRILAANPWEGDEGYDFASTDWYQATLAAEGEIVVTDAYIDVIHGKPVVTLAQKCDSSDTVLAFDVLPENFKLHDQPLDLPQGASYFLCDRQGTLLYAQTGLEAEGQELADYVKRLAEGLASGELVAADAFLAIFEKGLF